MSLSISLTKKMYGWSKWGGATQGMVKEELVDWHCQVCAQQQKRSLPSYMIPLDIYEREFIRVCSKCKRKAVLHKIITYIDLVEVVRHEIL